MKTTRSEKLFKEACELIPGGVNSPVRACLGVGADPLFIASAKGSHVITVDGQEMIDFVESWGPMLLGHSHPEVTKAVVEAAGKGTSYGAPCPAEVELARMVVDAFPGMDMVRMVNSGTEATMSALRLARGVTGRTKVLKFIGCYHGHADPFLASAGSGVATLSIPGTPGVPESTVRDTLLAPYNDVRAVEDIFHLYGKDIAAIIVEPIAGNMGLVLPEEGFLKALRALCDTHGALLIMDEVITGFRAEYGGAQTRFGITPDLTTLGKIIGGGMPVGAYCGSRELLEQVAPCGPVYQAGTLSGNPVAMAAGLAQLTYLKEHPQVYADIAAKGERLADGLRAAAADGRTLCGGNLAFIERAAQVPEPMRAQADKLAQAGKTPMFFSADGRLLGVIAVADVIKPDSPQAVRELRNMGIEVVMLTGDNERTARAIGAAAGVDRVIASVLPDGKDAEIRRLRERGKVAMVGDGINDAPALTRADVGIAIGAGADVALDAADVVLMKSRLSDVPAAIRLSRATLRNIHQNLFWAFFYNTLGIPLAAGVFVPLGLTLNPMFGAAAMSLSSFCVVSNALRLNLFKLRDPKHDHKRRKKPASANTAPAEEKATTKKEKETMKKTMKIEGMMCAHCEAAVKKALEAIPEVVDAEVSHTAGTAVVTLQSPVDDAALKKAVEDKDYKVLGIE